MHVRRDRSHLHFGKRARRRTPLWIALWLVIMALVIAIVVRFDNAQEWVLAQLGNAPTATPDAVTLAARAERAYLSGDLATAIDWYAQAAQIEPHHSGIAFEYGRMLLYQSYGGRSYASRASDALVLAEKLVEAAPDDAHAQALLCWALVETGRTQEAISAGLHAIELAPDFAEAHAYLSLAYQQAQRPDFMLREAERAVESNPQSVDARRALALALQTRGAIDAAIAQYERVIQLHPRLDALYFELAVSYKAQQNYEAAIAAYDRVLALDQSNVKAYTRLCDTQYAVGEWSRAQEACEQAIMLDPSYIDAYQQLGKIQYKRRNFEGAVESFDTCAALEDSQGSPLSERDVECYYIRALALAYLGDCATAWSLFSDALVMNPNPDETRAIYEGMALCAEYEDAFDVDDIPTPAPTPTALLDIIEVF